jgi:hypothetical protein
MIERISDYGAYHEDPQSGEIIDKIRHNGINRVVVSAEGLAVSPRRALEEFNIRPEIVFVRDDDWTLGAPAVFSELAEKMWADRWVYVIVPPTPRAISYADWKTATAGAIALNQ